MATHSSSHKIPFGAAKLCQDIATLFNHRQSSDIQFKVGGGSSTQENGEATYNESASVTIYAHSLILRCRSPYFAAMLDKDKDWKESSTGVIYKPNISPSTFQDVLYYIYTGNIRASKNIIELMIVADEMDLEELSTKCQAEFIRTIKNIFLNEDTGSLKNNIPIDIAIRTHIIPALNFTCSRSLRHLSQELLPIILQNMSVIIKSPDAYVEFTNGISSEALVKIIASDDLAMTEICIWELVLSWGCYQTKILKNAVETYILNKLNVEEEEEEEENEELLDEAAVNDTQLNQLKKILSPVLPAIRFSLLKLEEFKQIADILIYFLSHRRFLELTRFFLNSDNAEILDTPRKGFIENSKIIIESTIWELLRKNIFETGGIVGCHSLNNLKFQLLFRASEHDFLASTFHQRCDNKGPTLVIVRSADGHLFGGVNFNHWKSDDTVTSSNSNFLFSLPDGIHRKNLAIFRIKETNAASGNYFGWGPIFGDDLLIANSSNTNRKSCSLLPECYNGNGASNTALAGTKDFKISDYEVFAISK